MLRKKTTFVLGAGASAELGFPLGRELQVSIQGAAQSDRERLAALPLNVAEEELAPIAQSLSDLGHSRAEAEKAIGRIADGLSLPGSIDTFLYNNRADSAVVDCGKLYILSAIMHAEKKSPLSGDDQARAFCDRLCKIQKKDLYDLNPYRIPWTAAALNESYVAPIWRELSAPHDASNLSRIFENISFLNFNYDRSLEASLQYLLRGTFGVSPVEALKLIDTAKIVRPYGSPHGKSSYSEAKPSFGEASDLPAAVVIANFRTFTETLDKQVAQSVRKLVADSNVLVFLGFAFHQQNLDLIEVSDCETKTVYFSHYGDSDENRTALRAELSQRLGTQRGVGVRTSHSDIHGWIGTSSETLARLGQGIFRSR